MTKFIDIENESFVYTKRLSLKEILYIKKDLCIGFIKIIIININKKFIG